MCSQQQILSVHSRKRGLNRKPGPPVHDDLLEQDSTADTVNSTWLTDITEHPTGEGKPYLCAIKDCASNRIVGYSLDARMTCELAVAALRNAVTIRRPDATVVHSDQGSRLRSRKYVLALTEAGLRGSMGRVAACADNTAMESFFSLLQNNVLNRKRWATRDELRLAIVTWIERTYHRRRRQEGLGRLTPVEFEMIHHSTTQTATAA